jgi:hypothetical protein
MATCYPPKNWAQRQNSRDFNLLADNDRGGRRFADAPRTRQSALQCSISSKALSFTRTEM